MGDTGTVVRILSVGNRWEANGYLHTMAGLTTSKVP